MAKQDYRPGEIADAIAMGIVWGVGLGLFLLVVLLLLAAIHNGQLIP